jgi:hypothetical protein
VPDELHDTRSVSAEQPPAMLIDADLDAMEGTQVAIADSWVNEKEPVSTHL